MANEDKTVERGDALAVDLEEQFKIRDDDEILDDLIASLGGDPKKVDAATRDKALGILRSNAADIGISPEPAIEEGPHLTGENLKLKKAQLKAAGIAKDDPRLTGQMRKMVEG